MIGTIADLVRAAVFAVAQAFGGSLGAAIVAVSIAVRLALLPLTLKLARRALAQRRIFTALAPELERLRRRFARDPKELADRTLQVYRRAGYQPVDPAGTAGMLAQWPVVGALYAALRQGLGRAVSFLWIGDLAQPDALLALAVAAAAGIAAYIGVAPTAESSRMVWIATGAGAAITLFFCWHASAALVLSWGASTAVSGIQGILLRRETRHPHD